VTLVNVADVMIATAIHALVATVERLPKMEKARR